MLNKMILSSALLFLGGCLSTPTITYECVRDTYTLPDFVIGHTYKDVVDFEQQCLSELIMCAAE